MTDPLDPFVLPVTLADGSQALQAQVSHDVDPAAVVAALDASPTRHCGRAGGQ